MTAGPPDVVGTPGGSGAPLTPEQRAALDRLPPKRRTFVLAFVGGESATGAARAAGYGKPEQEGCRLLKDAKVVDAIEAFRAPAEQSAIATVDELRTMWTRWARNGVRTIVVDGKRVEVPIGEREALKASELLAKSQGAFLDRVEVSGPGGAPLEVRFTAKLADELATDPPARAPARLAPDSTGDDDR